MKNPHLREARWRKRYTMTISESQRFELHLGLQKVLGDDMANTLMEHLPPSGWSDVARRSDIDHIEKVMDLRFQVVDSRLSRLESTLKLIIGIGVPSVLALFAIQVQILISISNL
jgi:hypothetical protein